ncbi:hypothetical protein GN958_ATG01508 [Phytophthora infestans]|uniref:Uncharacterized protein n=1 Tax=Phytophthora infestans TaxID=4787 RepID=A0A8S9VAK2_PHYIN|nr:hypothetical protein GN958_ATG01508 [Phytophthora infestans]
MTKSWQAFRQREALGVENASTSADRIRSLDNQRPQGNKAANGAVKPAKKNKQNNKHMTDATGRMAAASEKRDLSMEENNNGMLSIIPLDGLETDALEYV